MFPEVIIILLNWNGLKDTTECLDSLKNIDYPNYKVVLVDNNSFGNDVEIIRENYGNFIFKIIINESNLGFSGGNNIGIKTAMEMGSDYLMLLNNDTVVEPDFLTTLVKESEKITEVGISSPMINFYADRKKIWSAGGFISKYRASGFTYGYNKADFKFNYTKYCTFASGCCLLIKREVIEKVGLLDENYFLYLEDTDYCQRANNSGFKILFVGASKIYHKVQSTTAKSNELLPLYYSVRNRLYFAKKNFNQFIYGVSFLYLIFVFGFKLIFIYKNKNEKLNILLSAFKDSLNNMMGQSLRYQQLG